MSPCRIAIITKYCTKEYIHHIAVAASHPHNIQQIGLDTHKAKYELPFCPSLFSRTGELMQTKAPKQRKTSRKDKVVSTSTPVDVLMGDAPPPNPRLGLVACPECGQRALFWNRHDRVYRCVNPECKRQFTLEEYQNREAGTLPDKLQTEKIQASVSATEAIGKQEPAAAEKIPSSELTTAAIDEAQLAATGQIPLNEPIAEMGDKIDGEITAPLPSEVSATEVIDKQEPAAAEKIPSSELTTAAIEEAQRAAIEQMPSDEPIAEVRDKIEDDTTAPLPSNVSAAEAKDEVKRGRIEGIPSGLPTNETGDDVKAEAKSAKKINRNLAFLLISVLAIGIVILGIFLFQKSGNLDELSSKLDKSRQALTQSQTQLAASQQDVEGLRAQLTQAQQEVEALQAQINELKPLTPSGPFVYSGDLSGNDMISFPIELKPSERVEGTITGGLGGLAVYIQDSEGAIVEDLGRVFHSSFTFTAQTSDIYALVIKEPSGLANKYVVDYTVYRRQ